MKVHHAQQRRSTTCLVGKVAAGHKRGHLALGEDPRRKPDQKQHSTSLTGLTLVFLEGERRRREADDSNERPRVQGGAENEPQRNQ